MKLNFINKCDQIRLIRFLKTEINGINHARYMGRISLGHIQIQHPIVKVKFEANYPQIYIKTSDGMELSKNIREFTTPSLLCIQEFLKNVEGFDVQQPPIRYQYSVGFASLEKAKQMLLEINQDFFLVHQSDVKDNPTPYFVVYRQFSWEELVLIPKEYADEVLLALGASAITQEMWKKTSFDYKNVSMVEFAGGIKLPVKRHLEMGDNGTTSVPVVVY